MQIFQTSSDVSTPEKLAAVIADQSIARYKDIPSEQRKVWIGSQIYALCLLLHYQAPSPMDVQLDSTFADKMIMEDESIRSLKQVEMQEAFRRGISREYGDFFGITASTIVQFLRAYKDCEKRMKAMAMLYDNEQKKLKEEDALFWKTLSEARERGFNLPEFQHGPFEDDAQHLERIAKQREQILKEYGHKTQE